jgi:carboxypeptidase C (cathepsin A)
MIIDECREKSRFVSKGEVTLHGVRIPYDTVCEDNFFLNEDGKAVASIFSYAYFRSDIEDNSARPILFAYNGGPGCGSLWVHMGLFGPKRLKTGDELNISPVPPFELEENPHCLLDICDIVLVDPVGTGLGRLFDESKKEEFFSTDKDVESLAIFIDNFLSRYNRHNSPVLLAGESYGTGRSALLVGELLGAGPENVVTMGIPVSGIMLLGSTFFADVPVEKAVLNLSSQAATYDFHRPHSDISHEDFVKKAEEFAGGEYLTALYKNDFLSEEEKAAVAEKLHYFTGIDAEYFLAHNLKVDTREFMHLVLKDQGQVVGYYDGRYTWKEERCLKDSNAIADDPAMGQYTPAFQSAFALMKKELGITFDRRSNGLSFPVNYAWDRKFKTSPADSLGLAMRRNKKLRVYFACGEYDLCTTAGMAKYLASHSNLDMDRVTIGVYPSGHMAYLGEKSAELLAKDMREFFEKAIEG